MKAVQKNITIFIWLCSVIIAIVVGGLDYSPEQKALMVGTMAGLSIITTVLYFLPIQDRIKAIVILVLLGFGCHGASIAVGGLSGTFVISFILLGVATLYFDPFVLLVYASIYIPVSILVYIINPRYILGNIKTVELGVVVIVAYSIVTFSLYVGTKTGSKIMERAKRDGEEVQENARRLEEIGRAISQNASSMYEQVSESERVVRVLSEEAKTVEENTQYLETSEDTMMKTFEGLNEKIHDATKRIEDNYELIQRLETEFHVAFESVEEGMQVSSNTSKSLDDILMTIEAANTYIARSTREVEQIGDMIKGIEEIAARTNLLAINAAIEAARVGDEGQGFHIVSEQIRGLSVQSKQASENIRAILTRITRELDQTGQKVTQGLTVISQGIRNLEKMVKGLENIEVYSKGSKETLGKEVEAFEGIKHKFAIMAQEVKCSIQKAEETRKEIEVVSNAVSSQTEMAIRVSEQLKGMEGLSNQVKMHFE